MAYPCNNNRSKKKSNGSIVARTCLSFRFFLFNGGCFAVVNRAVFEQAFRAVLNQAEQDDRRVEHHQTMINHVQGYPIASFN